MRLQPQIIEKDGKKEFVIIPYDEFVQIQAALEDLEDLRDLRKEKEESKGMPARGLREIGKEMNFKQQ